MEDQIIITAGTKEAFVFFCKISEPNPWFSNWYPSEFYVDGARFGCVEQYMMWKKAVIMGDMAIAQEVMKTSKPGDIKALGRKVKNFDEERWRVAREDIVRDGCSAKFLQNSGLHEKLVATGQATIAEAAPYDKIWGVGLGKNDPRILDKKNWLGENLLGNILMKVRQNI